MLEERFPGIRELVEQHGEGFGALAREWGFTYWSTEKTERTLGYKPRYNFPEFFAALEEGDRAHYPYADLPWWGI